MLWTWWPGFVVPACMVLGGLGWRCIRQLPYRRKEALNPEQLLYARETFCRTLWQLGLALGALIFMVMRSVRLLGILPQEIMTGAAIALELLSAKLVEPAVQRAMREKFGDTLLNGKEDEK